MSRGRCLSSQWITCVCTAAAGTEGKKGVPVNPMSGNDVVMVATTVVPRDGVSNYVVEAVQQFVKQLGYGVKCAEATVGRRSWLWWRLTGEKLGRRCDGPSTSGRPPGYWTSGECYRERTGPSQGDPGRRGALSQRRIGVVH